MEKPTFLLPVKETIMAAWEKVHGAKASIWAAVGITFLIVFGVGLVTGLLTGLSSVLGMIANVIGQLISTLLQMGFLYIGIQRAKNAPISFRQVFRGFEKHIALKIIGVYLIQFLIFFPLACLFILVPTLIYGQELGQVLTSGFTAQNIMLVSWGLLGVLVMLFVVLRLILSMGFVVDMGANPWPAVKMSFEATRGNSLRLISLVIIQIAIVLIAALPLGIGLIWAIPLGTILYGIIYKNLLVNLSL